MKYFCLSVFELGPSALR